MIYLQPIILVSKTNLYDTYDSSANGNGIENNASITTKKGR